MVVMDEEEEDELLALMDPGYRFGRCIIRGFGAVRGLGTGDIELEAGGEATRGFGTDPEGREALRPSNFCV